MLKPTVFCAGTTGASRYAAQYLKELGIPVTAHPEEYVQHVLLDVPSFGPGGHLRSGERIEPLLSSISGNPCIYGGNLNHPGLECHRTVDFLQDAAYLAENAYITAECALDVAFPYLDITLRHCPTLILGWGRIGKCLAQLLHSIGADVTIAARKESDRAMAHALGYHTSDLKFLHDSLKRFRLIFNTIPFPVLENGNYHPDCVKIELASKDGIIDEDVIIARGLPGIHMPESSGKLIAHTFLKYYQKEVTP